MVKRKSISMAIVETMSKEVQIPKSQNKGNFVMYLKRRTCHLWLWFIKQDGEANDFSHNG